MTAPVDPVRWRILEEMKGTIQAMTRGGGYWFEPRPASVVIDAVDLLQVPEASFPFYQIVPDDRRTSREFMPFRRVRPLMSVLITACVMAEGFRGDQKFQAAERAAADLERALTADLTRGGLVLITRVLEPDPPFLGTGSDRRVLVPQAVELQLERRYGTP